MRRLAWRSLSGGLIAALAACTGSTVAAPAPSRTQPAPAAVTSSTAGVRPPPAPPAATQSMASVVTGYYRAIVTRNYPKAFGYLAPGAAGPDGQKLTLGSFLQLARMLDGQGGPVTHFSVSVVQPMVVMTNDREKYGPYHAHLQMARDADGWTIISIDRI
ncbi:MAG: nuclear transport factor 2 family protein [Actinomycetota bacterium]|nr:nuclear transport factor 2 family protein [Actinomycetota bacterium]